MKPGDGTVEYSFKLLNKDLFFAPTMRKRLFLVFLNVDPKDGAEVKRLEGNVPEQIDGGENLQHE